MFRVLLKVGFRHDRLLAMVVVLPRDPGGDTGRDEYRYDGPQHEPNGATLCRARFDRRNGLSALQLCLEDAD